MSYYNILINKGATAYYFKKKFSKKKEWFLYKKVYINIFETGHLFYDIEKLESDLLIGFYILRKIGSIINIDKGVLEYKGKTDQLIYNNNKNKTKQV